MSDHHDQHDHSFLPPIGERQRFSDVAIRRSEWSTITSLDPEDIAHLALMGELWDVCVVFAQSIEPRGSAENEDVIGAAPTGDAPATSELSTILLPTKPGSPRHHMGCGTSSVRTLEKKSSFDGIAARTLDKKSSLNGSPRFQKFTPPPGKMESVDHSNSAPLTLSIPSGDSMVDGDVAPLSPFIACSAATSPGAEDPSKLKGKVKLTEPEIVEKMTAYIKELKEADDVVTKENSAKILFLKTHVFGNTDRTMRKSLANKAVSLGTTALFPHIWKKLFQTKFESVVCTAEWTVMKNSLVMLWNGTDSSKAMCEDLLTSELYKYVLDILHEPRIFRGDMENSAVIYTAKGLLGVVHNLLQNFDEARILLREYDAVNIVKEYRTLGNEMLQCKSLFNLAYLIDDKENELLNSNKEDFKFLFKVLTSVVKSTNHISRYWGYHAVELLRVINLLAANDSNKIRLIECGLLKHYKALLGSDCTEEEQYHSATGLYTLAFNEVCRKAILKDDALVKGLERLANGTGDEESKKMAAGALWVLHGKQQAAQQPTTPGATDTTADGMLSGHVMISYNWAHQKKALWIRDELQKAGMTVWMDVDDMSGSILQAMAKAIEKAMVILLCYSHKYFLSPNCRLEAEYAYQKKKPFIPVRMERYDPEDWLGIMIGAKLFFDFSRAGRKQQAALEGLCREINNIKSGKQSSTISERITPAKAPPPLERGHGEVTNPPPTSQTSKAYNWTVMQVSNWLHEEGLDIIKDKFAAFNGSLMLEMQSMLQNAPEFYYTTLRDQLRLSLVDILRFTKALKTL